MVHGPPAWTQRYDRSLTPDWAKGLQPSSRPHEELILGDAHNSRGRLPRLSVTNQQGDMRDITRLCFRALQLEHHLPNWSKLPGSIAERLNSVIDDIKPPLKGPALYMDLNNLTTSFKEEVRSTVRNHLQRNLALTLDTLEHTNSRYMVEAIGAAQQQLKARLGNKYSPSKMHTNSEKLKCIIGSKCSMVPSILNPLTPDLPPPPPSLIK